MKYATWDHPDAPFDIRSMQKLHDDVARALEEQQQQQQQAMQRQADCGEGRRLPACWAAANTAVPCLLWCRTISQQSTSISRS
jgi:hypothetical protein